MSNDVLSFLGWTFLPDFISTNLQTFYYKLTIRAGDPVPQPGTPRHETHRRRIYATVILVYLLYTLYEADWEVQRAGNFYTELGVDYDVEEKALQSRFRRLTLLYHPDKLSQSATDQARAQAEARYVHMQLARDTLVDPTKRFAYDRFGPEITEWQNCKTVKDYTFVGVRSLIPFYIGSSIVMMGLGWMGFGDWGKYWRYLAFACLGALELHTITRPHFTLLTRIPTIPAALLPSSSPPFPLSLLTRLANAVSNNSLASLASRRPYLPFQALRVAHRATIAFFIALTRLGPVLSAPRAGDPPPEDGDAGESAMHAAVGRLEKSVSISCVEAARLLALELVPFREAESLADSSVRTAAAAAEGDTGAASDDGQKMRHLREKIKDWFVSNAIRNDAEVQEAVGKVIERRRGGTAGAGVGGASDRSNE